MPSPNSNRCDDLMFIGTKGKTPDMASIVSRSAVRRALVVAAAAVILNVAAFAEEAAWRIDGAHSGVQFSVRHMAITTVHGSFGKVSGSAELNPSDPAKTTVDVTIDAASVDTRNQQRDEALRGADFFDVGKFPTLAFKSKRVEKSGSGTLKMTGDLTIHGVTKEVAFDVTAPSKVVKDEMGHEHVAASATTTINRKDFGLVWNRMVESVPVVSDEVNIMLDVELVKMPIPSSHK
jgi:polyisoprenoid-binding protein YceI